MYIYMYIYIIMYIYMYECIFIYIVLCVFIYIGPGGKIISSIPEKRRSSSRENWTGSLFHSFFHFHYSLFISTSLPLRVEFLLKTESGYLRDAEVTLFTLANP